MASKKNAGKLPFISNMEAPPANATTFDLEKAPGKKGSSLQPSNQGTEPPPIYKTVATATRPPMLGSSRDPEHSPYREGKKSAPQLSSYAEDRKTRIASSSFEKEGPSYSGSYAEDINPRIASSFGQG
jgi:hypothetical protein